MQGRSALSSPPRASGKRKVKRDSEPETSQADEFMKTSRLMVIRRMPGGGTRNQIIENRQVIQGPFCPAKKMLNIAVGPDELLKTMAEKIWGPGDLDELLKINRLLKNCGKSWHVVDSENSYTPSGKDMAFPLCVFITTFSRLTRALVLLRWSQPLLAQENPPQTNSSSITRRISTSVPLATGDLKARAVGIVISKMQVHPEMSNVINMRGNVVDLKATPSTNELKK